VSQSRWDIFCCVVDNYGDAGVAWRLARQLASEHGIDARLLIDDLDALSRVVFGTSPGTGAAHDDSVIEGVRIRRWSGGREAVVPDLIADVVIEAFGCGIPDAYADAMTRRALTPPWVILEYLSAERWVENHHGLASPHPRLPLQRHFFFPGFSTATGGLLRERGIFARRDAFRSSAESVAALWRTLGVAAPVAGTMVASLFCYPEAPVSALLDAWAGGMHRVLCVVPDGVAVDALRAWTGDSARRPGSSLTYGSLVLAPVPFLSQDEYDRLLWASDINLVRGEDSLIRAIWAARPLVWNAYPQAENAHAMKEEAFLARYGTGLDSASAAAHASFSKSWNDRPGVRQDIAALWRDLSRARPGLEGHARAWADDLAGENDLAGTLVKFVADRV
jgi:uncharacterized repeat protein (TIGR03837 family)